MGFLALAAGLALATSAHSTDFNGDGLANVVVRAQRGVVVVLGTAQPVNVNRATSGIVIRSSTPISDATVLGDVDGDGLTDLHVSTTHEYIVYGKAAPTDIDLDSLQPIATAPLNRQRLGDVNGDGIDDLAFANDAYVNIVYGRRDRTLGPPGFTIDTGPAKAGIDVIDSAGDANHDGIEDVVVVPENDVYCGEGGSGCGGHPFVIFGGRALGPLEITGSYRENRFAVRTVHGHRPAGYSINAVAGYRNVGSSGDFDGDGRADLFVTGWEYGQGTALIYGRSATSEVRAVKAPAGVRILHGERFGRGGGPVGDLNGDGRTDLLVTAETYNRKGTKITESLAVFLGRHKRATLNAQKPSWKITIPQGAALEWSGPLGDVNGDGLADFAVQVDAFNSPKAAPRTYVVFGTRGTPPSALGAGGFTID